MLCNSLIMVSGVKLENIPSPIIGTESEIAIEVSDVHQENAQSPIVVMESGITIEVDDT